jgi:ERCC4-type nuclease
MEKVKKSQENKIHIVIDSREQNPFLFRNYPVELHFGSLMTGDYSLKGFEKNIALERKSLPDLISCFTSGRDRFKNEMERMRSFESCAIIVESPFIELAKGNYRSKLPAESAVQSVISIMQEYRMPVWFAANRVEAEHFTWDILRHFYRHAIEKFKSLQK